MSGTLPHTLRGVMGEPFDTTGYRHLADPEPFRHPGSGHPAVADQIKIYHRPHLCPLRSHALHGHSVCRRQPQQLLLEVDWFFRLGQIARDRGRAPLGRVELFHLLPSLLGAQENRFPEGVPGRVGLTGKSGKMPAVAAAALGIVGAERGQDRGGVQPGKPGPGVQIVARAGPAPVAGLGHHPGADRVEMDVGAEVEPVGVVIDQDGVVSALEDVAVPSVSAVAGPGVIGAQPLQGQVKVGLRGAEEEMIMVVHQAESEDFKPETIGGSAQERQEKHSVLVIGHDGLVVVAPGGDMVDGSGKLDSQWPGHTGTVS